VGPALAAGLLWTTPTAALTQPNGATIPTEPGCDGGQPTGLAAELSCVCQQPGVCNIGDVCSSPTDCDDGQNGTCETTMWHSYNDNTCIPSNTSGLDPYAEASVTPETFKPTCPQTFSLITRGTAMFQDAFGWYNVTGSAPQPSDLHVMLDCSAQPGDEVVLDVLNEPGYLGGEIGFFIITPESHSSPGTCAGDNCCASVTRLQSGEGYAYYSERDFNPDFAGNDSYIHLLTYQSHVWNNKFYFAWEDIHGGSNNDFTDLVTGVSGIHCAGGGQPCDTGSDGICGLGITTCDQGELGCESLFDSFTEQCNGVDDDCDGAIDDDPVCPNADDICHQGSCVPPCSRGEFPCPGGTECDNASDVCVHPTCVGVTCTDGEVCRQGSCVEPCDGVVCPHGQRCLADKCVDLCASVSCSSGEVCVEGKCMPGCAQCNGITCNLPLSCDTSSGQCLDDSCATECPDGTYCSAGECKDQCEGVVCPGDQVCVDGQCQEPGAGGAGGSGLPGLGGAGSGAGADDQFASEPSGSGSSCACGAGSSNGNSAAYLLLFVAPTVAGARRRRWRRR
jgi:hypothetical protein